MPTNHTHVCVTIQNHDKNNVVLILNGNTKIDFKPNVKFLVDFEIEVLQMDHCQFTKIYLNTFMGLPSLQKISIEGSNLTYLDNGIFQKNTKLMHFDGDKNNINYIDSMLFYGLKYMKTVSVKYNREFTFRPNQEFLISDSIEVVHLSGCNIKEIYTKTFLKLPQLQMVYLDDNKIQSVDSNAFLNAGHILELDFEINQLASFPSTIIDQLPNLEKLILEGNKFIPSAENNKLLEKYNAKNFDPKLNLKKYYNIETSSHVVVTVPNNNIEVTSIMDSSDINDESTANIDKPFGNVNSFITTVVLVVIVLIAFFVVFYEILRYINHHKNKYRLFPSKNSATDLSIYCGE